MGMHREGERLFQCWAIWFYYLFSILNGVSAWQTATLNISANQAFTNTDLFFVQASTPYGPEILSRARKILQNQHGIQAQRCKLVIVSILLTAHEETSYFWEGWILSYRLYFMRPPELLELRSRTQDRGQRDDGQGNRVSAIFFKKTFYHNTRA